MTRWPTSCTSPVLPSGCTYGGEREIDLIVERADHRIVAIEVKLGDHRRGGLPAPGRDRGRPGRVLGP